MNSNMNRISPALTEASVTSPTTKTTVSRTPRATNTTRTILINTDSPLVPTVKAEQMARAMKTAATAPPAAPNLVRPSSPPVIPPSGLKKFLMLGGVLMASVGVVAGFISIVVLGPIGLAVAAGAAALAAAMIWLGSKVK